MQYDVIIIGAGSAGLPAAIYAARYGMKALVIGELPGGALATSHRVENWPGTIAASGRSIMDTFLEHAKTYGSEVVFARATSIEGTLGNFRVSTNGGETYESKTILLATGNTYRRLGVPGEKELLGSGVSYCATCDGNFFRNQEIAVVGGGDSAATEALYLAEICSKVTLIVRKDSMKAEEVWKKKIAENPHIEVLYNSHIESIEGKFGIDAVRLNGDRSLIVAGVFVAIGSDPDASLITPLGAELDHDGCVKVDSAQRTNIAGVYAAGDVTTNSNKYKQAIMSAAEGCLAAHTIHEDLLRA